MDCIDTNTEGESENTIPFLVLFCSVYCNVTVVPNISTVYTVR